MFTDQNALVVVFLFRVKFSLPLDFYTIYISCTSNFIINIIFIKKIENKRKTLFINIGAIEIHQNPRKEMAKVTGDSLLLNPWRLLSHPRQSGAVPWTQTQTKQQKNKQKLTVSSKTRTRNNSVAVLPFDLSPPPIDHDLLVTHRLHILISCLFSTAFEK